MDVPEVRIVLPEDDEKVCDESSTNNQDALPLVNVGNRNVSPGYLKVLSDKMSINEFVKEKFKQRICIRFVPKQTEQNVCQCGRERSEHRDPQSFNHDISTWSVNTCTRRVDCVTCGRVRMLGYASKRNNNRPSFIRVDHAPSRSDLENLWTFMQNYWNIPAPDLILTFKEGPKGLQLDPELHKSIVKGLAKVASCTNVWMLTGGNNSGLDRLVGEVVGELSRKKYLKRAVQSVTAIGFATWGSVMKNSRLEAEDPDYVKCYIQLGEVCLNSMHTHFILVDDGKACGSDFNAGLQFRKSFERFMIDLKIDDGTQKLSVIQLMATTAKKTALMYVEAAKASIPVVLLKGTGKSVDALAKLKEMAADSDLEKEFQIVWKELKNEDNVTDTEVRKYLIEHGPHLHVFDCTGRNNEFDKVILAAYLCENTNPLSDDDETNSVEAVNWVQQLRIIMKLGRHDLAKEKIFTEASRTKYHFKKESLYNFLFDALLENRPKFVEMILEQGVAIRKFLTYERLYKLYHQKFLSNTCSPDDKKEYFFYLCLRIIGDRTTVRNKDVTERKKQGLLNVATLINIWADDIVPSLYKKDGEYDFTSTFEYESEVKQTLKMEASKHRRSMTKKCRDEEQEDENVVEDKQTQTIHSTKSKKERQNLSEQDLFFWALLFGRWELAELFWGAGKDQISAAQVACQMLESMSSDAAEIGEVSLSTEYEEESKKWSERAVKVLQAANDRDQKWTNVLLTRALPQYKGQTCLSLADEFLHYNFLGHDAPLSLVKRVWRNNISLTVSSWQVLLAIIFYPIMKKFVLSRSSPPLASDEHLNMLDKSRRISQSPATRRVSHFGEIKVHRLDQATKKEGYFKEMLTFYNTPWVTFDLHVISYVFTLLLFSYFVLVKLAPVKSIHEISWVEWYIWIWGVTYALEEAREILEGDKTGLKKITDWLENYWNIFDLVSVVTLLLSVALRFLLSGENFSIARNAYAFLCWMLYVRSMQFYYISTHLGPKVVIAGKMVQDVVMFLALFLLAVVAFGVLVHSVVYPNSELSMALIGTVIRVPFWQTFGSMEDAYMKGDENCTEGNTSCAHKSSFVRISLAVCTLFTNVLLLNLLIAMFNKTYEDVASNSREVWAHTHFQLVQEYEVRTPLPFPFSLLAHVKRLVHILVKTIRQKNKGDLLEESAFRMKLDKVSQETATKFEFMCYCDYIDGLEVDKHGKENA